MFSFNNEVLHGDNCYYKSVGGEKFRRPMYRGELDDFATRTLTATLTAVAPSIACAVAAARHATSACTVTTPGNLTVGNLKAKTSFT